VQASAYLNKLSDIMRFMLYETKSDQVALSKELTYIEKYIELQRIRTSNPNYVQFTVEGECGNHMIEPMLFIPFIENAFKHSESKKNEDAVRILFSIGNNSLRFICENRFIRSLASPPDHSGLGNDLIRKRLELLYPGKHDLSVKEENGFYKVYLVITNHEN
jgi:two-component system LytT family sensor kinase